MKKSHDRQVENQSLFESFTDNFRWFGITVNFVKFGKITDNKPNNIKNDKK